MLFKVDVVKENLLKYFLRNESNFYIKKGIEELVSKDLHDSCNRKW